MPCPGPGSSPGVLGDSVLVRPPPQAQNRMNQTQNLIQTLVSGITDRHGEMTRKTREGTTQPAVSDPEECRGLHAPAHRAHPPPFWPPALPRGSPMPATGHGTFEVASRVPSTVSHFKTERGNSLEML